MTAGVDSSRVGHLTVWFADGGVFQHFGHFAARKHLKSAGGHGPRYPVPRADAVRVLRVVLSDDSVERFKQKIRKRVAKTDLGNAPIDIERGRELLRGLLGEIRIAPRGGYLVAKMGLECQPLLGGSIRGSGGPFWHFQTSHRNLRRSRHFSPLAARSCRSSSASSLCFSTAGASPDRTASTASSTRRGQPGRRGRAVSDPCAELRRS